MSDDICGECGQPRSEHHAFVPVVKPEGCKCDPNDWVKPQAIPPVCKTLDLRKDGTCYTCEHPEECHG